MNSKNQKVGQVDKVEVSRVETRPAEDKATGIGGDKILSLARLVDFTAAPLSIRPSAGIDKMKPETVDIPNIRLSLYAGNIVINGKEVKLPIGVTGLMSGKELKQFAEIYQGDTLFVRRNSGLQRIRDTETVEVVPDVKFAHRRPAPKIRSTPRYGTD